GGGSAGAGAAALGAGRAGRGVLENRTPHSRHGPLPRGPDAALPTDAPPETHGGQPAPADGHRPRPHRRPRHPRGLRATERPTDPAAPAGRPAPGGLRRPRDRRPARRPNPRRTAPTRPGPARRPG